MSFDEKVLNLTKKIPKGKVTTYKIIANRLKTRAYRAVGNALNRNNKPIIIPCHRVINTSGALGGYRGGLTKKIALLKKEGIKIKNKKVEDLKKVIHHF